MRLTEERKGREDTAPAASGEGRQCSADEEVTSLLSEILSVMREIVSLLRELVEQGNVRNNRPS